MAVCDVSNYFNGNDDNWFHFNCFWRHLDPKEDKINLKLIQNVDRLRWEDQETLRDKIAHFQVSRENYARDDSFSGRVCLLGQLKTEKSKTNRGKCYECGSNFYAGETKMNSEGAWVHAACLFASFDKLHGQVQHIPGWDGIDAEEQNKIFNEYAKIPEEKRSRIPEKMEKESSVHGNPESSVEHARKRPIDEELDEEKEEEKRRKISREAKLAALRQRRMKRQVDRSLEYRKLFRKMSIKDREIILEANDQDIPVGEDMVIDRLADNALFGCPIECAECPDGKIVYNSAKQTYVCTGYATEYTKCPFEQQNPVRTPFQLPVKIRKQYKLSEWTFNEMTERLYLKDKQIGELDVVQPKDESEGSSSASRPADADFVHAAEVFDSSFRIPHKSNGALPGTSTHIIKKGTVVDAKFPHADRCHILKDDADGQLYQVTLSFTDLTTNKNSFYKIQLLKEDIRDVYYVFCSWGRVGTEMGDTSTKTFNREQAIEHFRKVFFEQTKNDWKYRKHFRKWPGKFNFVETDFSEFEGIAVADVIPGSQTLLPPSVKDIVMSIFDLEKMKSALKSFEMDVNKMPLGRMSQNQITSAFSVLTELGELLAGIPVNTAKIVDASNKFYTIIPHNFGMKVPEPIDSLHKIKEKNNMLNALLEIKYAYDQVCGGERPKDGMLDRDPIDTNYEKLNCGLTPLERTSSDWKHIEEYMQNTKGSTHDVNVELIDILCVHRADESTKFKRDLGNRVLLWHGSGKMNFAGILGQGLRIAPPEAPVSGYMFGKGVYFADMFSKSVFYCRASQQDEAYLLLCDVALGKEVRLMASARMSAATLPEGTASVKGLGRESPDPAGNFSHPDGYMIPKGQRIINFEGKRGTDYHLLYNEFIVYNVDQVLLKYLVRVKLLKKARHI
ncbi:unnamed protein product [Caenorhabditis sp. 36 PRJEB53466]|nr:unnamed protein product [Caenorhabditis sp. 36 PRJEB53466]